MRIKNLGGVCALASIVCAKGSTPRPEFSKLLVRSRPIPFLVQWEPVVPK